MPSSTGTKKPDHDYSTQGFAEVLMKQSAEDILKGSKKRDFFHNMVKAGTSHALRGGLVKIGLPDHIAQGIGDHYTIAYELINGGKVLSGRELAVFLAQKGIAIARMGNAQDNLTCGISVAVLAVSIVKTTGALLAEAPTGGAATPILLVEVGQVVLDAYSMNQDCKLTDAVNRKITETAQPMYMWLENGIKQWMGVPGI
ncbi:hypothetical protein ACI7BZ_14110 [Xanthobacter sp. AM11]|uniref:hypothetical protein n=1 Tax=Xanthobacter sp. AM11 TaxID=3380643 RepID=UPI0039BF57F1